MANLAGIASGLLSLEVNTIICDGMTAEKMPVAAGALIDIAQGYHHFLCVRARELEGLESPITTMPRVQLFSATSATPFVGWKVHSGDLLTFAVMRRVARACQDARGRVTLQHLLRPEHDVILDRIVNNCDLIKDIFLGFKQPDVTVDQETVVFAAEQQGEFPTLGPDALVQVRKIWEVGTDTIAMQTVIQIDGDVMSRVQVGRETEENRVLHQIHRNAVEACFQHWSFLVKLVEGLIDSTLNRFFPAS
jgi:hypothetical protein